jgi:hypothetical protein
MLITYSHDQSILLIVVYRNKKVLRSKQQKLMAFVYARHSSEKRYDGVHRFVKLFGTNLHLYDFYTLQFLCNTFVFTQNDIRGNNVFG